MLLVISFFLFHNIYLVIIGISLAYYQISKNDLDNDKAKKKEKIIKKEIEIIDSKQLKISDAKIDEKESLLTLVEAIEELGYIPTANTKDDSKAA